MNMQKEKRIFAAVMFWLFACFYTVAQQNQNPFVVNGLLDKQVVHSPEVTAMMRNITYPVNYSTGVPDITIPIYEVKCGELTLPITLSYHASGVKPNEPSNWVGQDWSLNAEPIISRKINGHIDSGFKMEYRFLDVKDNWDRLMAASDETAMLDGLDCQPDEYYYRLPNASGKFMYSIDTQKYVPIPYNSYKYETGGKSFHITDDNGNVYKFDGGMDYLLETSLEPTAWRCSGIYSPNKHDSITFGYSEKVTSYSHYDEPNNITVVDNFNIFDRLGNIENSFTKFDRLHPFFGYPTETSWAAACYDACYAPEVFLKTPVIYITQKGAPACYVFDDNENLQNTNAPISKSDKIYTTKTTHVKNIMFNGCEIQFVADYIREDRGSFSLIVGQPLLKNIIVYNSQKEKVKEIEFHYYGEKGYQTRYYLQKIIFSSVDSDETQTYEFTYNHIERTMSISDLRTDFWVYFNGRSDYDLLVPKMTLETHYCMYDAYRCITIGFDDSKSRSVNEDKMKYGIIESIKYPTGAVDEFDFEANRTYIKTEPKEYPDEWDPDNFRFTDFLQSCGNDVYKVGGLRIKQIKTTTPEGSVNLRSFTYGENEDGLGFTPINNQYNYFLTERRMPYIDMIWHETNNKYYTASRYRIISAFPQIPITYEGGVNALYDYVTEYNGTPEHNSGKTVYHYSCPIRTDNYVKSSMFIHGITGEERYARSYFINDKMWKYCNLLDKKVYANTSEGYKVVNTVHNEYYCNEFPSFLGKIRTCKIVNSVILNKTVLDDEFMRFVSPVSCFDPIYENIVSTGYVNTTKTTETNYTDDGQKYTTETSYGYTSNPNVTYPVSKTIISLNDTVSREEYKYPAQLAGADVYNEMVGKNILSPVVYKKLYLGDKTMETQNVFTKIADGIFRPTSVQVKFGENGKWETRMENKYNSFGKLVESVKDGKECVSYIYGYNGNNCIATVANVRYDELLKQTSGYITSLYNKNVLYYGDFHILIQLIKGTHYTLYQYKPLIGLSAKYMSNGTTLLYDYDGLGRLKSESIKADGKTELLKSYNYNYENK